MSLPRPELRQPRLLLPDSPALVAGFGRGTLLTPEGELFSGPAIEIGRRLRDLPPPMLVHGPASAKRLGLAPFPACDLLELFAFCLPARPAAPTPRGLAMALERDPPAEEEALAALLPELATDLLRHLAAGRNTPLNRDAAALAARLGAETGWPWADSVLAALGQPQARPSLDPLKVWRRLPDWEEAAPPPPPTSHAVSPTESRQALARILGEGAEQRPQQSDYASAAAGAFQPRETPGAPNLVLAEAGTGTGKTLGYVAPASLWATRNGAPVWISTFTRNLQRQIDQETARLYPDPADRRRHVVVRKGRENYLCLLNMEEAVGAAAMAGQALPLALIARWALATRDGDLQGGDFPGWLAELFGPHSIWPLADRRGECIHSACGHYKQCFVEHSIRRARTATLVVANHALVMIQAALGGGEDGRPLRLVFDEGHHLFDAADAAFSADLTGAETAELRRWLLGAEGGRSRARGLARRLEELIGDRPDLLLPLEEALQAARALPGPGWPSRLAEDRGEEARGTAEAFLQAIRRQVLARARDEESGYGLECDLHPLAEPVHQAAEALATGLTRLRTPLQALHDRLAARLEDEAEELELGDRIRIEAACRGLERRALMPLAAWVAMLGSLAAPPRAPGTRPDYVDWFALDRREGREVDCGMHRHHLDPTQPFAMAVAAPAHGLLITSATLRDHTTHMAEEDPEAAWRAAEARTGAAHLPTPAIRAAVASPFDYATRTRALVVEDVNKADPGQVASAYRALFAASGGGALGLFTAVRRLRDVQARIAQPLAERGIPLYAQHVDAMDNATLVDVFRAEEAACLLGTDAMRDGVDVPGRSLRLLVFDRVPWPRPSILHRERRTHLSEGQPKSYDDAIARHRLRQAFGRLIRRGDDKGVFVLLDRSCPTRLLAGLPPGVVVQRMGLRDAVAETRDFLAED
ncbi:ATP-dependent DNA helicase [Falsiroseomonas selenitidurans]|uniref:ATP-dependent DNA helicase n=1 Tax=Falsiroseomonas selenitidurans TaxID=2716335 RepID=A0ABX1DX35_9PROT|nr:ATP-dependent DNA helicase [Falsiroseomonas selenitidurans]NKC29441.1 ATP-dependent DNA helicase [Falsiroseomonas selenitidurans]